MEVTSIMAIFSYKKVTLLKLLAKILLFAFMLQHAVILIATAQQTQLSALFHHVLPSSLLTENEYRELKLAQLPQAIGRTKTALGPWALQQLLQPIDDIALLQQRQSAIKQLVDNDALYTNVQQLLQKCKAHEAALLSYWVQDSFLEEAQNLYFTNSLNPFKNFLNTSRIALDFSLGFDVVNSVGNFVAVLGLMRVKDAYLKWVITESDEPFDLIGSSLDGIKEIKNNHNPYPNLTKDHADIPYTASASTNILWSPHATMGDRQKVIANTHSTIFSSIKYPEFMTRCASAVNNVLPTMPSVPLPQNIRSLGNTAFGWLAAGTVTAFEDYKLAIAITGISFFLYSKYKACQKLHKQLYHIAQYLKTVQEIETLLKSSVNSPLFTPQVSDEVAQKIKTICDTFNAGTFNSGDGHLYSRGNVLKAHRLLLEQKSALVPLLKNIAQLDAYYSMATYFRECKAHNMPICFVEFIDANAPQQMRLVDAWVPTIAGAPVPNTITLDTDSARFLVITGPNGCGKSTILKTIALSGFVLPQTCGISCARAAHITISNGLRTSLQPEENAPRGLSTFMAELESMQKISTFMHTCNKHQRGLVLISEPFRGTVGLQTVQEIMNFGRDSAKTNNCLMALETHEFEPTKLATEFPNLFVNGHMRIHEPTYGEFEKAYILDAGAPEWWFNDSEKVSRFVLWLKKSMRHAH